MISEMKIIFCNCTISQLVFCGICLLNVFARSFTANRSHNIPSYLLLPKSRYTFESRRDSSLLCVNNFQSTTDDRTVCTVWPVPNPNSDNIHLKYPLDREVAAEIIENDLFPSQELTKRSRAGREAQGIDSGTKVDATDPRLALTYGEFPMESFDTLVDRAMEIWNNGSNTNEPILTDDKKMKLIDLGSGCGRLLLYAALSRCSSSNHDTRVDVHGIEISELLHEFAVDMVQRAIEMGLLTSHDDHSSDKVDGDNHNSILKLHLGAAEECAHVLEDADIIFAYSK